MTITNLIGVVDEIRGQEAARIKVLSFKKDGKNILASGDIKSQFPPHGYVFAPHFFNQYPFEINSIIEFKAVPTSHPIPNGDIFILDSRKDCKAAGIPVISVLESILINQYSINQPILKGVVDSDASYFYIKNSTFIYGPFRNSAGEILPKVGMDVNRYESNQVKLFVLENKEILLDQPTTPHEKVDCMTPTQLGEWLKSVVKGQQSTFDFNLLKKLLDNLELQNLNKARLERVCLYFNQISLTISEFRELSNSSETLNRSFSAALEKIKEELKETLIEPFSQQKSDIEKEISRLSQNIQKLKKEEDGLQKKYKEISSQCAFITEEKERLISDVRVQAEINQFQSSNHIFYSYDEQVYDNGEIPFESISEFVSVFKESMVTNEESDRFGEMLVFQLKDFRLLLSQRIGPVLQIAKLSNNCRVVIQQVEPNWLRFENLFNNGLSQIWGNALKDNNKLHFLILEDINLASIECYGKPLNDLNENIRMSIPGLGSGWPQNLWIFGIPVPLKEEHKLGLPLIKETFNHWGAFPKTALEVEFSQNQTQNVLTLDVLLNHNIILAPSLNEYF